MKKIFIITSLMLLAFSMNSNSQTTTNRAKTFTVRKNSSAKSSSKSKITKELKENESSTETILSSDAVPSDDKVYDVVEEVPTFPGGEKALAKYLRDNLQYPSAASDNGIQGCVMLSFIVERDGSISHIEITRLVDPSLAKEAMRLVKSMPKWNPGKQNGKVVRTRYNLPINFRLK